MYCLKFPILSTWTMKFVVVGIIFPCDKCWLLISKLKKASFIARGLRGFILFKTGECCGWRIRGSTRLNVTRTQRCAVSKVPQIWVSTLFKLIWNSREISRLKKREKLLYSFHNEPFLAGARFCHNLLVKPCEECQVIDCFADSKRCNI